jgi:gliding motility-associated-like protein
MNKRLLVFIIVFYSLNLNARDIPVSSNLFVNSLIDNLTTPIGTATFQVVRDFGDAPISYGSADHIIDNLHYMGSRVDGEASNQPSPLADADDKNGVDDEDGVIFPALTQGATVTIPVTLVGSAYLNIWIDWNGDGDFADSGEWILSDSQRSGGTVNLSVTIPVSAITSAPTFARFRYGPKSTTKPTYSSSGSADYGEVEDYQITILCAPPAAPTLGTITQPTCAVATGSVILNGLPSSGTWTLIRTPGGVVTTGSGTSTTISGLPAGTYTYTVTNAAGCRSGSSGNIVINAQPLSPAIPLQTVDCSQGAGKGVVTVTSPLGAGLEYRIDAGTYQTGTIFTSVANGNHTITVRNSSGCTSTGLSFSVTCGCTNPTTVTLGSNSGVACGTTSITVDNNTFGGSATSVTITENGAGSVTPTTANKSPFSFTYTPAAGDAGKTVIITVTTNNPAGSPCIAAVATYTLTVDVFPTAPVVGTITQPTCASPTGSVILSGLPATGTWRLIRMPGVVVTTGSGTSTVCTGILPGSYTYTVTNASGCGSGSSANVVINAQPPSPAIPLQTIDCSLGFGKAVVTVTSPMGAGLEYRLDGGVYQTSAIFTSVANGSHTITVRNSSGCTAEGVSFSVSCSCLNPPVITLSRTSGSTCGTTSLTVNGNTFGGSATSVTITENGSGSVSPSSVTTSPFAFTYTPETGDAGKTVIITLATNNPLGSPCAAAVASYTLTVNAIPSPPAIGIITQPTCNVSTGSVILTDLPAETWTLTLNPGGTTRTGSGINTVVSDLSEGTHTFSVTSSAGCISPSSANVVINPQPQTPGAPLVQSISQPTCSLSAGSVVLNGLPSTGIWILTRYPGTVTLSGTGSTTTVSDLTAGIYNFTITNSFQCTSIASANVVISVQPSVPTAPVLGTITQPTCFLPTGMVVLTGLPATGTWTLNRTPDGVTVSGTGTSTTVTNLPEGTYRFTVKNSDGCTSVASPDVIINPKPVTTPVLKVTNPPAVCFPATVDLTSPSIIQGSTPDLLYSFWRDLKATISYNTPSAATGGTYYLKGTTIDGCFDIKPVVAKVYPKPSAMAGPDQVLEYLFETKLEAADPAVNETGKWSLISGSGEFADSTFARTPVSGLSVGENKLLWTVTNAVCLPSRDSMKITVNDLFIPTLITPNGDNINEYFVIKGLEALGKTELIIFDRRGAKVYINENYDNKWNGVDFNGDPLPENTYYYGLKAENGRYFNGYIVIRYNAPE